MPLAKTDNKTHVQEYIDAMDKMLSDPAYDWAWDRINDLKDWVEHNRRITPEIINVLQGMRKEEGDL